MFLTIAPHTLQLLLLALALVTWAPVRLAPLPLEDWSVTVPDKALGASYQFKDVLMQWGRLWEKVNK